MQKVVGFPSRCETPSRLCSRARCGLQWRELGQDWYWICVCVCVCASIFKAPKMFPVPCTRSAARSTQNARQTRGQSNKRGSRPTVSSLVQTVLSLFALRRTGKPCPVILLIPDIGKMWHYDAGFRASRDRKVKSLPRECECRKCSWLDILVGGSTGAIGTLESSSPCGFCSVHL